MNTWYIGVMVHTGGNIIPFSLFLSKTFPLNKDVEAKDMAWWLRVLAVP